MIKIKIVLYIDQHFVLLKYTIALTFFVFYNIYENVKKFDSYIKNEKIF